MKYRKKPVIINAEQWMKHGDNDNVSKYCDTILYVEHDLCPVCKKELFEHGLVETLEGYHRVCPGDWIITGVQGERYPCKPDIFELTYEIADNEDWLTDFLSKK